jgi:26S proteasome regulatory subunit T3
MGDVLVDHPANSVSPSKKQPPADSIPNIDSLEGSGNDGGDEYSTLKRYQRHLEYGLVQRHLCCLLTRPRYIKLQEEYIKDEQRSVLERSAA